MKLYVFGFWGGFLDNTNPVGVNVFLDLFQQVFRTRIELGDTPEECDILLETVFVRDTHLYNRYWKYSFLFSGESYLNPWNRDYTCVLYGERNHDNVINMPLFLAYLHSSRLWDKCACPPPLETMPPKDVCVIIGNAGGGERNAFLEILEKRMHVDYAGNYKNNVPRCEAAMNTPEFADFIRSYKFIITMENSRGDTYITEKITHGMIANTIPVYWGSLRVQDYFNQERLLNVSDISQSNAIIDRMVFLLENPEEYLKMVQQPVFREGCRLLDHVVRDIRHRLFSCGLSSELQQVVAISSPVFESSRFHRLSLMFQQEMELTTDVYQMCCPTYKHTVTPEMMTTCVKQDYILKERIYAGMKRSEISLFLNYRAVLENIVRNYSDGVFLVLESDVQIIKPVAELQSFIQVMRTKRDSWDVIHLGSGNNNYFTIPYINNYTPYRENSVVEGLPTEYVEDLTKEGDRFRMVRKYQTRCTDTFLWNYSGVVKFLNYMTEENLNYGMPLDYYMCQFFEIHYLDFKHYWSIDNFFIQRSNEGLEPSSIQTDWN